MPDSIQHQKDDAFRNAAGRRRAFPAFLILGLLCVGLALVYVFQGMTPETWDFNMARRIPIVIALVLVGTAVGLSSVVFQTITTNYILTPSVMGLDNLYVLLQTLVLYFVGSTQLTTMQSPLCFMGALLLMVCVSTGIFFYMFRGQNGGNIYFVVLVGMIFGITFGGLSNFMQVLIDPSEFAILEGRLFASFNRINEELLLTAGLVIAAAVIWLVCDLRKLDVLTLGRSTAITLGVNYKWVVLRSLIIVSILASASTVLVGPVTFLGILIVSIARFIFPTYRHIVLMPGTALVGVAALTFGMLLTERWLNFSVPLSVIINFVGGVYFIYLRYETFPKNTVKPSCSGTSARGFPLIGWWPSSAAMAPERARCSTLSAAFWNPPKALYPLMAGNSGNGIPGSLPKPSPSWGKPSILRRGSRSRNWFASDVSLIPAAAWKIRIFCKSKRLWNLPRFPICAIATLMNFRAASGRWPILPWPLHRTRSTSFSMNL